MTWRSTIAGLLAAALLAGITYFNDLYLRNTFLTSTFFPISAVGLLIVFVLFLHPLIRRFAPGSAFTRAEWATAFALLLCAAHIPGRGIGHNLTNLLMLPFHYERTNPGWQGAPVELTPTDVVDWAGLVQALSTEPVRTTLAPYRPNGFTLPEVGAPVSPQDQQQLLGWLNRAVHEGTFEPPSAAAHRPEIAALAKVPRARRTSIQQSRVNRAAIEAWLSGLIRPRRAGVLEWVPPNLLADPQAAPVALDGFVSGLSADPRSVGFRQIPWRAWSQALAFWVRLILAVILTSLGLALVVHRQWMSHEHLAFPTMEFARSILPEENGVTSTVIRTKWFRIAMFAVALIHTVNYLHLWWPERVIPVNLQMNFTPLTEIVPVVRQGWGWHEAFNPRIFFTIVGFAFFLSKEVSFSLGVAPYLFVFISGWLAGLGVATGGNRLEPHIEAFINSGAFFGLFATLMYSGRHYFRAAFGRGLGLPMREPVESHAVWGARAALVGCGLIVGQIVGLGIEWPMALLYTFWLVLVPLVVARLLAESGVFFLNPRTYGCALLWGWLGAAAVGRASLLILSLISVMFLMHVSLAFLPFAVSAFRVADETGVKPERIALGGLIAAAIALAVVIPVNLRLQYRYGAIRAGDGWTSSFIPRVAFDNAITVSRQLEAQGRLEASDAARGWNRWKLIGPRKPSVMAFSIMCGLVLLFGFLRHHFPRWPFHPAMFAVMAVWPSTQVGFSFLLGWAIKTFAMKYGGPRLCTQFKPLMLGLIAGEALGALIQTLISLGYYLATGQLAPAHRILPG